MSRVDALVTDAHFRWSVAGIRGLGRAGIETVALGPRRTAAGLWSRYVKARELGPDPLSDAPGYVAAVARVAKRRGPIVVYPGEERAIDALTDTRLPPEAVLPYPAGEVMARLRDKRQLAALAAESGLGAPRTLALGTVTELRSAPPRTPCAIKAVHRGSSLDATRVAATGEELLAILDGLPDSEVLLVQEALEGPLTGLALVVSADGSVAARFQQVTWRTWPVEAGGSTLATSVAPDDRLVESSARMLAVGGYWGLAHLQFLRSSRGLALIDVNTRFYGSLPLALAAGVNLASAWHAVTVGDAVPRPGTYSVGVTYRWFEAELAAAFRGNRRLMARRAPQPRVGAMWAIDDPLPSLMMGLGSAISKLRRRLPSGRG
jgi:predicted ATP-grasp superfamily ATP-dependent carboligase